MGPNGSGKSTLAHVLMGRPGYEVLGGSVTLDGVDLLALPTWQRARAGLFLAMQHPIEVPGVSLVESLTAARARGRRASRPASPTAASPSGCTPRPRRIGFDERFLDRPLNVDLSGGERKRNETLQLGVLRPRFAVLDEIDSGLDVDALGRRRPPGRGGHHRVGTRRAGHHPLPPPARRAPPRRGPRAVRRPGRGDRGERAGRDGRPDRVRRLRLRPAEPSQKRGIPRPGSSGGRLGGVEPLGQRVPAEGRALDAHRELDHALERGELAECVDVDGLRLGRLGDPVGAGDRRSRGASTRGSTSCP